MVALFQTYAAVYIGICHLTQLMVARFSNIAYINIYHLAQLMMAFFQTQAVDISIFHLKQVMSASVAKLDAPSDWRPGGRGFNPRRGRQHSFVEIDHEIFSTVILSLPLIQEGQLSVSGERMRTILVNRLED